MAYEKNTWKSGDVVTSAKLNHMEDGIANAGGTLVIGGFSFGDEGNITGTADKTWQEIHDALVAGKECAIVLQNGDYVRRIVIGEAMHNNETGTYSISVLNLDAECNSPDGYPAIGAV